MTASIGARSGFGDPARAGRGEIPVLRAGGVASRPATASRVPFAIPHAPGHMFVTDVPDAAYQV